MKICALELPASFGDPHGRLADVRAALAAEPPADLVLLPECALTGYISEELRCDLRPFAEPLEGPTLDTYRDLARTHAIHLAGPLIEDAGGAFYNSFVVVDPQGELRAHYRKRHPWFPERWAKKGDTPYPLLSIGELRVALAICFDVHFLGSEAGDVLALADVLLFPSAWVDDDETDLRGEIFAALVRRFGLTVVNANWGPGAPRLPGQGASRVVGPAGTHLPRPLATIACVTAEVSPKSRTPRTT
jgi:predicted amidohydrolase